MLEVMNDCTILLLTYHLWCFTDMVGDPEVRYELGYIFIAASLGNIAIHLCFMFCASIFRMRLACKRRKLRKAAAKRQQSQIKPKQVAEE